MQGPGFWETTDLRPQLRERLPGKDDGAERLPHEGERGVGVGFHKGAAFQVHNLRVRRCGPDEGADG